MIEVLKKTDYKVSDWSGGKTEQIFIYPPEGDYAKRQFQARISSATVLDQESDFTFLEGTKRFITILSGKMCLTLGGRVVDLAFGDVLEFSGEEPVHCVGQATDFNLMLKGADGVMETVNTGKRVLVTNNEQMFVYAHVDTSLLFEDGQVLEITKGDCAHISGENTSFSAKCEEEKVLIAKVVAL